MIMMQVGQALSNGVAGGASGSGGACTGSIFGANTST